MPSAHLDSLEHFSKVLQAAAPVPRLRILVALAARGPLSSRALAQALELAPATCSRHLQALAKADLIEKDAETDAWRLAEPRTVAEHVFVSAVVSASAPDARAQLDLAALRAAAQN